MQTENTSKLGEASAVALFTIPFNCSVERVKDLLCSAFEGGSNYWIDRVDVPTKEERKKVGAEYFHESPVYGLELAVHSEQGCNYLTQNSLKLGMIRFAEDCPKHFADWVAENDDAITADVFLQYCLFGKAIYG